MSESSLWYRIESHPIMTSNEKDPLVSSEAGYGSAGEKNETNTPQPLMTRIKETLSLFWYLGFIAFGGPTAHVAILRDHLVSVNKFIDEDIFTELFALGGFAMSKIIRGGKCINPPFVICHSPSSILIVRFHHSYYIYRSGTSRSKFYATCDFDSFNSRRRDFRSHSICLLVSSWIRCAFTFGFVPIQLCRCIQSTYLASRNRSRRYEFDFQSFVQVCPEA